MAKCFAALLAVSLPGVLFAQANQSTSLQAARVEGLSAPQLFEFADKAKAEGDLVSAAAIYEALSKDPDIEIRTEARFRHGQMLAGQKKFSEAALLYRAILDEKSDAQRVRLELAYVLAQMDNLSAAQRELRLAQAGGLPPEVSRMIDQFTNALRANKPYGASFEIALAPDNNINRATRAETLDTIIAPFDLTEDAQAQAGLGLAIKGQAFLRTGIDKRAQLLVRLSGSADIYEKSQFDDMQFGIQAGPEMRSGKDRLNFSGGYSRRYFGGDHYSDIISISGNIQHPMGTKALLTGNISIAAFDNKANDLQDGTIFAANAGYERAFSSRFGAGVTIGATRQALADPGYATTSGSIALSAYRQIGQATLVGSAGYSRLEADRRLFLFPARRIDDRYTATLGVTLRQLQFRGFAPLVRLEYERNDSTAGIYKYERFAAALGITRAF